MTESEFDLVIDELRDLAANYPSLIRDLVYVKSRYRRAADLTPDGKRRLILSVLQEGAANISDIHAISRLPYGVAKDTLDDLVREQLVEVRIQRTRTKRAKLYFVVNQRYV